MSSPHVPTQLQSPANSIPTSCVRNNTNMETDMKHCALCGEPILDNPPDPEDRKTDEHTPPKQFIHKARRVLLRKQLWQVPSHRKCNGSYKLDEEYFYLYFAPLVAKNNPAIEEELLAEW